MEDSRQHTGPFPPLGNRACDADPLSPGQLFLWGYTRCHHVRPSSHSLLVLFIENPIEGIEVSVPSAFGPRVKRNLGCVPHNHVTDAANQTGRRKVFPHNVLSLYCAGHMIPYALSHLIFTANTCSRSHCYFHS